MTKVSSSNLKAKMGKYIRAVRSGKRVVVTDRDVPVALLIPFTDESSESAPFVYRAHDITAGPLGDVEVKAIEYHGTDTTALLIADRQR